MAEPACSTVNSSPEQMRDGASINQLLTLNDADLKLNDAALSKSPTESGLSLTNEMSAAAIENASFLIPVEDVGGALQPSVWVQAVPESNNVIVKGSPGHTPFPVVGGAKFDFVEMMDDSLTANMPPPSVPCNSPDDTELMEALKMEARKQESEIKAKIEGKNLMELFKSPLPQLPGGQKSRKRRNRKDLCSGMTVEDLEKLSNDKKITEYHSPMSINEKEVRRRNRISSCVCMLRKIVPGITEDTENTEVFETSAKYILYLKQKIGGEFDREFLSELMPL